MKKGIFSRLKEYREKQYLSLHMPGHKSGKLLPPDLEEAFGREIFSHDLTEVEGMDNLQKPLGPIKDTEDKIKALTGAQEACLLVNGSSGGLLASLYALARDREIFLARNSHQAVYNGLLLAQAHPIWLGLERDGDSGTELGISPETLKEAIEKYPDCKLLLLTLPNYYGIRYKARELFKLAKENNLTVIIDEAHGAHFNFLDEKYPISLELGADLAVQSWHKTLPVFNQGSLLLKGESLADLDIRQSVNLFQTTSPSYLIMASMDASFDYLSEPKTRGKMDLSAKKWQDFIERFNFKNLKIFTYKEPGGLATDPFKLLLYTDSYSLQVCREIIVDKYRMEAEIFEEGKILFMLPLFYDGNLAKSLEKALYELDQKEGDRKKKDLEPEPPGQKILKIEKSPAYLDSLPKRKISLEESQGKISAQKIIKYPPGIPLLFPGQILTEEIVCYLKKHKINYSLQDGIEIYEDQEKFSR